jgi:N-acetylmuramoyl-L-alanine amidase
VTPNLPKLAATLVLTALTLAASKTGHAQPPPLNRNVIVLDPAHGGPDTGARLSDTLAEKQATLAFAARLRPMLQAAGFTVVATRDADPPETTPLTADQRAGTANHVRALACILIHATLSGTGAHIFTSALAPSDPTSDAALPWASAQASYIPLSTRLANEVGISMLHANIPPLLGHASIRPIDNLTCPAIALELAPLVTSTSNTTPISDAAYQQRAAQAVTEALVSWRNHAVPPATPTPAKLPTKPAIKPVVSPSPAGAPRSATPPSALVTPKPVAPKPTVQPSVTGTPKSATPKAATPPNATAVPKPLTPKPSAQPNSAATQQSAIQQVATPKPTTPRPSPTPKPATQPPPVRTGAPQ